MNWIVKITLREAPQMLFWTNYLSRKSTMIFPNSIPLQGLNDKYSCLSGKPISKVMFEDSFFF